MKTICSIIFFKLIASTLLCGQVIGDFQTKNATGNWSDFNAWNIYNGSAWIPALAGQIPVTTASVFLQSGNTINVDIVTAVCNDLNFTATGTTLKVILLANNILTIYGSLNQFDANNIPFPAFGAGAKIIFAGNANQVISNSGASTNLNIVEINKSGGSFTLPGVTTKFDEFTLTSGSLIGVAGSNLQGNSTAAIVNVNGGNWTQNSAGANRINGGATGANCTLNINTGTMTLTTTSGLGFNFSSVIISNGGILNLNNDIAAINTTTLFSIDATSTLNTAMVTTPSAATMNFAGTVNYMNAVLPGTQNIITTTYGNLGLGGTGNKNPSANIVVANNLSISGMAVLNLTSLTLTIAGNWASYGTDGFKESASTVDFNGNSAQLINTTGGEDFFKLKKSGSGTLTLNSDVSLDETSSELNISNGVLDAGTFTLSGTTSTAFVMSGGTLRLAKLSASLPEFTVAPYSLTAGIIELYGAGSQILRGNKDYRNLTFSGSTSTTLGSNPKSITGTVYITGSSLLDIENSNGFGDVNTNLTMDGGRLKMSGSGSAKPDIDGTYNLTAGVIEFAGANVMAQPLKGKSNAGFIIYKTIEVTGTNVGTSLDNIYLSDAAGAFTVKSGAAFSISSRTIKSNNDALNTSTITVENNAIFKTGNDKGFSGDTEDFGHNSSIHSNIAAANIILNAGSTVDYISTGAQTISNQTPYYNFIISSASGIKTAPSGTLTISGNFTKSGNSILAHNNGTVVFANALTGQDYICTSTVPVNFYDLNINNTNAGLSIVNNMSIENALTLYDNSKLNCTTGDITLLSTAVNTARVAEIPATAIINYGVGRFNVERFFPNNNPVSHRAWRLVTAPLNESGDIFDEWQLSGAVYGPANIHRGTLITGPQIVGNGLDITPTNNYSLKKYDGTNFINVDNTHTTLSPAIGNGCFLFVRGDRNPILTNIANSDYTTLSCVGKLQTGPVNISVPGSYGLVGNPYASPVDFNLIDKSDNIYPHRFYVFDPNINQVGAYVIMEDLSTPGVFKPTAPNGGSSQDNNIQSGQAFFVEQMTPGAASITFRENNKASFNNPAIFRPMSDPPDNGEYINANLYLLNNDATTNIADGIHAEFGGNYSDEVDIYDAPKFGNINETFSFSRHSRKLAVERRSLIKKTDTMFFHIARTTPRNYQLEFIAQIKVGGVEAFLEDIYTKSSTPINLSGTTHVNFSVNGDSLSAVVNRFRIIFKESIPPVMSADIGADGIVIYPNPVANGIINLKLKNQPRGKYQLCLYDNTGQALYTQSFYHQGGNATVSLKPLTKGIANGTYLLKVFFPNNSSRHIKLMLQTKTPH